VSATDVLDAFRILRRSLSRAAAGVFGKTGVGARQVVILRELRRTGAASQIELARATASDPAAMMRALDALERRGWVKRSNSATDRRCKLVSLTEEGRAALGELDVAYEALRSLANGALSSSERKQFCAAAAKLTVILEAADIGAPPDDEP
jgi:DNA-binding MarR family transcriptional regulator